MNTDEKYMRRCLELAQLASGNTAPNPMVGSVVVHQGRIIGEGYHQLYGQAHAEANAIRSLKDRSLLRESTLYVNLEPCCFQGKTPPCVEKIIAAGIRQVVVAMIDPNPAVNGRGIEQLQKAGIQVKTGVLEEEARQLNRGFIAIMTHQRPWVTLKLALTADGFIADVTGKSQWISSDQSRSIVKQQRQLHDGIMVGMGTVFKDDPGLLPAADANYVPYRIVLDESLKIPYRMRLVSDDYRHKTLILTVQNQKDKKRQELYKRKVGVYQVAGDDFGWIDIAAALDFLKQEGLTSLYCEGGGQLAGSLITAGLIDELQLFVAPKIIGEGIFSFSGFMKSLDEAYQLTWQSVEKVGPDIFLKGKLN